MSVRRSIPPAERIWVKQYEAAELLSISTRHLRRLTKDGLIPVCGEGRALRYAVADLRAFAERNRADGGLN